MVRRPVALPWGCCSVPLCGRLPADLPAPNRTGGPRAIHGGKLGHRAAHLCVTSWGKTREVLRRAPMVAGESVSGLGLQVLAESWVGGWVGGGLSDLCVLCLGDLACVGPLLLSFLAGGVFNAWIPWILCSPVRRVFSDTRLRGGFRDLLARFCVTFALSRDFFWVCRLPGCPESRRAPSFSSGFVSLEFPHRARSRPRRVVTYCRGDVLLLDAICLRARCFWSWGSCSGEDFCFPWLLLSVAGCCLSSHPMESHGKGGSWLAGHGVPWRRGLFRFGTTKNTIRGAARISRSVYLKIPSVTTSTLCHSGK